MFCNGTKIVIYYAVISQQSDARAVRDHLQQRALLSACGKASQGPIMDSNAASMKTPEGIVKKGKLEMALAPCKRKLYTPKTRANCQIRRANSTVASINKSLLGLYHQKRQAAKRGLSMTEYRYKMDIATTESVKSMYVEYIRRKHDELAAHIADSCHQSEDITNLISPNKPPRHGNLLDVESRNNSGGDSISSTQAPS